MTTRIAIIGLVLSAIVFVTTLTRPQDSASQWPPLVAAAASAAVTFFYIWFLAPLLAWLGMKVVSGLRSALGRSVAPDE